MSLSEVFIQWVTELDELSLKAAQCDLPDLKDLLEQRQQILAQIQTVDVNALDDAARTQAVERLHAIQERDNEFVSFLGTLRKNLEDALDTVTRARQAARAYGSQQPTLTPSLDETA